MWDRQPAYRRNRAQLQPLYRRTCTCSAKRHRPPDVFTGSPSACINGLDRMRAKPCGVAHASAVMSQSVRTWQGWTGRTKILASVLRSVSRGIFGAGWLIIAAARTCAVASAVMHRPLTAPHHTSHAVHRRQMLTTCVSQTSSIVAGAGSAVCSCWAGSLLCWSLLAAGCASAGWPSADCWSASPPPACCWSSWAAFP